jgi:hypothetical protein
MMLNFREPWGVLPASEATKGPFLIPMGTVDDVRRRAAL